MADLKLKVGTATTLANANGGSLANNVNGAAASADLANQTNLDEECALELSVTLGTNAAAGDEVQCFLVPLIDGTNLAEVDSAYLNADHYVGSFWFVKVNTSAQRLTLTGVRLQPILYRAYLFNRTGKTISANWTLKAQGYIRQN